MNKLRSLNIDYIFYTLCIIIISVFSVLLFIEYIEKQGLASAEKAGKIVYNKKTAQRKYPGDVIWEKIKNNSIIFMGDTIRTGEKSSAVINLNDGTNISMTENSMMQIQTSDESLNVNFIKGSVFINRKSGNIGNPAPIKIKIRNKKLQFINSDIRIFESKNNVNILSNRGSGKIISGDREYLIDENNEGIIPKSSGNIIQKKRKIKLVHPGYDEFFRTYKNKLKIDFKWEAAGKNNYLEISTDKNFSNIKYRKFCKKSAFALNLSEGIYYWRIRDKNLNKENLKPINYNKFTIIKDKKVALINPFNGKIFRYVKKNPIIDFQWDHNLVANGYILEISKDKEFKNIIKSIHVYDNNISLDSLNEGDYYWRIKTKSFIHSKSGPQFSSYSFKIIKSDKFIKLKLFKPKNKKAFVRRKSNEEKIIFSCIKYDEIDFFDLFIYKKNNRDIAVYKKRSHSNFITLDIELVPDEYTWLIEGYVKKVKVTTSEIRNFSIIDSLALTPLTPSNNSIIFTGEKAESALIKFSWATNADDQIFLFKLFKGENAALKKNITGKRSVIIDKVKPGEYKWIIYLLDKNKDKLVKSKSSAFTLKKTLIPPKIISPADNSTFNILKEKNMVLSWKKSAGADLYKISFYREHEDGDTLFEKEIKESRIVINNISEYGKGSFYLTLQAVERGSNNKIIQKSGISKRRLNFTRKQLEKPKIEKFEIQ